jgi:uncharacterized membrane protein
MTKFCTNCGATVAETARFCNKCGTRLLPTQPASEVPPPAAPSQTARPQTHPQSRPYEPYQPGPMSAQYSAPRTSSGLQPNLAGALSYLLGLVSGIIFLALDPYNKDRFIRFHAFQSIFLFIAWIGLYQILGLFTAIMPFGLSGLFGLAQWLVWFGGFVAWLYAIYKAYQGEMYKIPVIGDLAERQAEARI